MGDGPPEEQGREEEGEVLGDVPALLIEGAVEEGRHVPEPHRGALDEGGGDGGGEPGPDRAAAAGDGGEVASHRRWEGPEQDRAGAGEDEEEGGGEHDQLVLDHVHEEAVLACLVQGGAGGGGEGQPARPEQDGAAAQGRAALAGTPGKSDEPCEIHP